MRNAAIRRKIRLALEAYRAALSSIADPLVTDELAIAPRGRAPVTDESAVTVDGVASVAVSLIHGCALQAVIDPKGFDVRQHFAAAAQMIERVSALSVAP